MIYFTAWFGVSVIFNKRFFFPQWKISSLFKVSDGMLKLKLQYFGHLVQRADSFEKTLMLRAGGEGDDKG